jgi:type I restriction enzyme M protein
MDVFFGAGVASHPTIIEQINYLLFMRALSQNDDDLRKIGITDKDHLVFDGDLEKYRWDNLLTLNAEQLFIALEDCFRHIPESTTNKTVRLVFRNAHIKLFDKPTLRTVLHEIDAFAKLMDEGEHAGKRDIFGDTYEYLLSKLAQAGTSGQFRTPRHIIEFLVDVVAPKKGETIIDPAVGTAGFLVKAFEYLRREYTTPEQLASGGSFDQLNSKEHTFLHEHTFSGFDSDEDMIKFGMMNLYLHGLQNARMVRQNTLTDTAGSRDKYDVILANPPFSGKIDRDSVAEELQMNTGATEVLFLRYMMRHLTDNGRAGVIVPEGVLFNASSAHTKIRELLLENGLWCVTSLPSGVFNPYAGVKTSILFFDKTRVEKAEVLFAKVENDGFSLSAQRKPITKNDLPEILADIERYENGEDLQQRNTHVVSYERIKESKDFNLTGDRYKLVEANTDHDYPMIELGDSRYFRIESGGTPSSKIEDYWNGDINWVTLVDLPQSNRITNIRTTSRKITPDGLSKSSAKLLPAGTVLVSSRATIGRVAIARKETSTNQGFKNIVIQSDEVLPDYVANVLSQMTETLKSIASGGTFAEFSKTSFEKIKIPLPPIEVQRKIVEEIENKQTAIDHARAIISTLERERELILTQALAPKKKAGQ